MRKYMKVVLGALMLVLSAQLLFGAMMLNGAGATFPYPLYMKWASVYNKEKGVQINYASIGSGGGVR
ncbi:MAG: hypothetical protein WC838_08060 [Candidatus Margulisiibacteriota bacterium]